jgi:hypothetical protein
VLNGAFAAFDEKESGSLTVGKRADVPTSLCSTVTSRRCRRQKSLPAKCWSR